MNKFERLFQEVRFPLIVSLPANSVDLAQAAADGGADAVKVHTAVSHFASGSQFGSLEEEAPTFEEMRSRLSIPLGIVPGTGVNLEQPEIDRLADLGFDFFDAFIDHITPLIWSESRLAPMLCVLPHHTVAQAAAAASLPRVVCLEADIVEHDGYGQRLSVEDCATYQVLASAVGVPLVVPTQRAIRPAEVAYLAGVGVGGLMIGAIVTGSTSDRMTQMTRAFRDAIDQLPGN